MLEKRDSSQPKGLRLTTHACSRPIMRGIEYTFSRLPAARALIAAAAMLASAAGGLVASAVGTAQAQSFAGMDDIAFAMPRRWSYDDAGVALPQPLAPSESVRLRRIFAWQGVGRLEEAGREAARIDLDRPLGMAMLGHVLADRYLGPHLRVEPGQLRDWLDNWPGLPDAASIHRLLRLRAPRGSYLPPMPTLTSLGNTATTEEASTPVPEETEPAGTIPPRNPVLDRATWDAARSGGAAVNRLLAGTRGLSSTYAALLRGEAARILFTSNRDRDAYEVASPAAMVADGAAQAGFVAGLAAWRMQRPDLAQPMFEAAWRAPITTSALRAGAAFWAARAHLANRDPVGWFEFLARAGAEQRTFYGMLARRMQGLEFSLRAGRREVLGQADVDAIAATGPGLRAFALLQIGQTGRADAEFRLLWPQVQGAPGLARALMLVADRAGLLELASQLADLLQVADGQPRDQMRFPVPRLRPRGGFSTDPALIYGIARTESNFDPACVSAAGARGLMQIMPETARFVGFGDEARVTLHDPAVNLDLGQRYMAYLAGSESVGGDLLRLLASYNAGPGSYGRWGPAVRDLGDPLLFIESVPGDETRAFIPRVLAYTWIYAARLHLPAPSLDDLAAGAWPRYPVSNASQGASATLH